MNIKYKNYTLEPEDKRFNLYKAKKTETKEGKQGFRNEVMGYAMPFEHCIDAIAKDLLASKDGTSDISTWIRMYKEEINLITNILKQ